MEGKPARLKRGRENAREERRLRCSTSEQRQFFLFFLFRPDVLSVLPPSYEYGNARRQRATRSTCVVYTPSVGSVLCLWFFFFLVVITLTTRGLHSCVVPASSGCTTAILHTILLYYRGLAEMVLSYHLVCFYDSRLFRYYIQTRIILRSALSNNFSLFFLSPFARY